jgi:hypothetical protein
MEPLLIVPGAEATEKVAMNFVGYLHQSWPASPIETSDGTNVLVV